MIRSFLNSHCRADHNSRNNRSASDYSTPKCCPRDCKRTQNRQNILYSSLEQPELNFATNEQAEHEFCVF